MKTNIMIPAGGIVNLKLKNGKTIDVFNPFIVDISKNSKIILGKDKKGYYISDFSLNKMEKN